MDESWAHSKNDDGIRHRLIDHLRGTGALARQFGDAFDVGAMSFVLGVLHDAGKALGRWQRTLLLVEPTRDQVGIDHVRAGTWLAYTVLGLGPFAGVIDGHHKGLPSTGDLAGSLAEAEGGSRADVEEAVSRATPLFPESLLSDPVPLPDWLSGPRPDKLAVDLLIRMVFSTVVDADRLDTHRHFHPEASRPESRPVTELSEPFERQRKLHLEEREKSGKEGGTVLAGLRERAYQQAVAAAVQRPGIFRLPAPTGLGKTILAAGFALAHARHHGMRRVIVAVPFTSVTEQNARVYRDLLGDSNVLEHHSGADLDRVPEALRWQKLASENWDSPFIVTTTVQLFESVFSNRPGAMRKLHRLAGSVIVLDEVQALPDDLLLPILSSLRHLTEYFGCTVLLSSATQPEFWSLEPFEDLESRSVLPDPEHFYRAVEKARNIQFEWLMDRPRSLEEIADLAADEPQVLVIVNTTENAARLHQLIEARRQAPGRVIHLSKRMASAHIRATVADIVALLKDAQPVAVISTQLVEAGVDFDFPLVMRQRSPLDSIIQAAGRCNRECLLPGGRVIVFSLEGEDGAGKGIYGASLTASASFFRSGQSPYDRELVGRYYKERYDLKNIAGSSTGAQIQELRAELDFPAVAAKFQMIKDRDVPVVVPYEGEETARTRASLLGMLRSPNPPPPRVHRKLRPLLAALPASRARDAVSRGLAVPVVGDLLEWRGDYHPLRGIELPKELGGTNMAQRMHAYPQSPLAVEVSGDYACFTRPELKTERMSYEVITPSAACGVLESIFWKPEFRYVITRIELLRKISWTSVRRNEVSEITNLGWVRKAAASHSERFDAEQVRDQRNTVLLRDVGYRIYAQIELKPHADGNVAKYRDQFRRRVQRGSCFQQPFLGMREFAARFGPVTGDPLCRVSKELGVMLHSINYQKGGKESYQWFWAELDQGVMKIPPAGAELPSAGPASRRSQGPRC